MSAPKIPKTWHDANCHCGKIRFRLRIPPLYESSTSSDTISKPISCNCSICTKNGYLNIHLPGNVSSVDDEADIAWVSGKDELKRYKFGNGGMVAHFFCPNCGSSVMSLADLGKVAERGMPENMRAEAPPASSSEGEKGSEKEGREGGGKKVIVNARMIRDVDLDKLTLQKLSGGSSWGKPYDDGWKGIPGPSPA